MSVLSAMQSDAFGASISNPPTGCTSPVSSDDGNNIPALVSRDENLPSQQTEIDQSHKEIKQDNSDGDLSEEDSSGMQETSLKPFGKTVIIPDPRKACSSDGVHGDCERSTQSSNQEMMQASSIGGIAAYTAPNGCHLAYNSLPFHLGESGDARIAPLHVWWPYYGFPIGHRRGPSTGLHNEATSENETGKSPSVESSSDSVKTIPMNCKVFESRGTIQMPKSASNFELKPSVNSAFVRVKPSSSGDHSVRGFVPYKRCKVE
ncbi:uncharacterized protein LOC133927444 [Phragmites australis]|uniref:uncharacterized protein LOC133927444 n=1 Tax=Phragmites australis TaxID=29695 RepID=UPI002D79537F|nr:uncharacterized protein LOC133927444 [Phragmites australis]